MARYDSETFELAKKLRARAEALLAEAGQPVEHRVETGVQHFKTTEASSSATTADEDRTLVYKALAVQSLHSAFLDSKGYRWLPKVRGGKHIVPMEPIELLTIDDNHLVITRRTTSDSARTSGDRRESSD